jgi:hypothetical protein
MRKKNLPHICDRLASILMKSDPICSNSHYKNRFFESPPLVGFQKTDLGVSSAEGAGNTQIGFIMRIAALFDGFWTFCDRHDKAKNMSE